MPRIKQTSAGLRLYIFTNVHVVRKAQPQINVRNIPRNFPFVVYCFWFTLKELFTILITVLAKIFLYIFFSKTQYKLQLLRFIKCSISLSKIHKYFKNVIINELYEHEVAEQRVAELQVWGQSVAVCPW